MRSIRCFEAHFNDPHEALEEFNERMSEFGIRDEKDIISISVNPANTKTKIIGKDKQLLDPKWMITIFFWSSSPV